MHSFNPTSRSPLETVTRITLWTLLPASVSVLMGCSADSLTSPDDIEDALKAQSVVLVSTEARPLTLTLSVLDGVKEKTKNSRFIRVTAERDKKSFSAFCSLHGDRIHQANRTTLSCVTIARTVGDDDNESLEFDITKSASAYSLSISYSGDGTFLGAEADILSGRKGTWSQTPAITLKLTKGTSLATERNPFVLADRFFAALSALAGEKIYLEDLGVVATVKELDGWQLSEKQEISVDVSVGNAQRVETLRSVSVLQTPGVLASGLAANTLLLSRVKAAIPTK